MGETLEPKTLKENKNFTVAHARPESEGFKSSQLP